MKTMYKLRWISKQMCLKIIPFFQFWPLVAIMGIGISFYQLLVSNNVCPALLTIGNNAWDPIYQDLAISYLGGSILWIFTALLPNEVRKGYLQKQLRKQLKDIYKQIWEDLSKYTSDSHSIYWRPLNWLHYKYPNFNRTLQLILLKVQWNFLFASNEFVSKYTRRINDIYNIYSDIISYKQRKKIENILDMFRKLSNQNSYKDNIKYLSKAIITLYNLGY